MEYFPLWMTYGSSSLPLVTDRDSQYLLVHEWLSSTHVPLGLSSTRESCSPDSVDFMLTWYPLQPVVVILVFGRPFSSLAWLWASSTRRMRSLVESSANYLELVVPSQLSARITTQLRLTAKELNVSHEPSVKLFGARCRSGRVLNVEHGTTTVVSAPCSRKVRKTAK